MRYQIYDHVIYLGVRCVVIAEVELEDKVGEFVYDLSERDGDGFSSEISPAVLAPWTSSTTFYVPEVGCGRCYYLDAVNEARPCARCVLAEEHRSFFAHLEV